MAYRLGARKIMLVSCDESFVEEREGAEKLANGLFSYPQQLRADEIIDGNLHWFITQKQVETKAANYSDGPEYKNAVYIKSDEQALAFFLDDDEEA